MGRNENTNRQSAHSNATEELQLKRAREQCRSSIAGRIKASNILGDADCDVYDQVMSDTGLAIAGKTRLEDKLDYIREIERSMVPKLLSDAKELETEFTQAIQKAVSDKWISGQKARWWIGQLHDKSVAFHKKHFFVKTDEGQGMKDPKIFKTFLKKWGEIAEVAKKLRKHPQMKKLSSADVSNLSSFMDEGQFLNLSYKNREALVKMVDAALTAKARQMPELYSKARAMLQGAAQRQAISSGKVSSWLQRIFSSNAKADEIEQFLNNKGSMPLQKLIDNWSQASKHFHKIEAKRKSLGTPPGFHFVNMNVFLNWHFDQRQSYLAEAEHRFVDINKEPGIFLQIRHELGANDWDSAEDLIDDAKRQEWSPENQRKLHSMEVFLKYHRREEAKKAQQSPTDDEIMSEMHSLLEELPPQLQRTYRHALSRGYQAFWVLTTLMYNRVWCHQHNFLDTGKEKRIEQKATTETRERLQKGHTKYGFEANVIKGNTNTRPAVRDQAGVKGAQVLYTDERSEHTLVDEINEQKNDRNFWYWTSMIPQGVEYNHHLQIVQTLHPRMKRLARLMDQRGIRTSLSGEMTSKPVETSYAMAA